MGILMRIGEAAQFLGVSQSTLRRWTNGGLFPVWRSSTTGNRYLYVEDLDRWVAKRPQHRAAINLPNRAGWANRLEPGSLHTVHIPTLPQIDV